MREQGLFFKLNWLFTLFIFISFLSFLPSFSLTSFPLALLAAISSASILYFLLYLLLFIPLRYGGRLGLFISSFTFLAINFSLIGDFFIYRLYHFHINAMVLNLISSPSAIKSMGLGAAPFILGSLIFLALLGLEFLFYRLGKKYNRTGLNKKLNKTLIIPLLLIIGVEKVSFGFASLYHRSEIISSFSVIPLYQPLTFSRFAAKYFGHIPKPKEQNTIDFQGHLNYPRKPLKLSAGIRPHIFIFASDSVKADMVSPEITPFLSQFQEENQSFKNHYSASNTTRFGIFSLFYGLNPSYWFSFLRGSHPPVFFEVLKKLQYNIQIISSTSTRWPEFRRTVFKGLSSSIQDSFPGAPWQADKGSSEAFIKTIKKANPRDPIFSFVFLDAPHGYSAPPSHNPFKSKGGVNYVNVTKENISEMMARYKNSLSYNDQLVKKMIEALKENGLYENSLIIYTSDHGQEFFEYGFFGHNSAFSKAQVQVPFFFKLPEDFHPTSWPKENEITSHLDIAPTILWILGLKNSPEDYANGQNLFSSEYKRDSVVLGNWNHNAIMTKDWTYVFSNLPNKLFSREVRKTSTYEKVSRPVDSERVLKVMEENRHFMK